MIDTHRTVRQVADESYGRLVAFLAGRCRDLSAVEDALSEAFVSALESWPETGIPAKPEAWLLTVARRRLIDAARHARVHSETVPTFRAAAEEAQAMLNAETEFPDERLKLLFVCAHPAIDVNVRTPLMLQTVLHLDAARIASVFLMKPAAMGQRLSRAKAKIRDARIPFEIPEAADLPRRLGTVLEAVYAAYGSGWDDVAGTDLKRKGLATEAIDLGRLLIQLMPQEPESRGLLSLMLHCEARRTTRRSATGEYIPLSDQDPLQWSRPMIDEGERLLQEAAQMGVLGPFQLEAAIQSVHSRRLITGFTDWGTIMLLYEGLVQLAPTIGGLVGRAAAVGEAKDASAGLALLDNLRPEMIQTYQPYWASRSHLLRQLGRLVEARSACERAIGLCEDEAMRAFLKRHMP